MKDYLINEDLTAIFEQEYIFQVLQGSLKILGSSQIYDQSLIMNCFLSTVTIESSKISNLQYSTSPMHILDSTFILKDTEITSITTTSAQQSFIVANSGSLRMESITFKDSNSQMLLALSSNPELVMVTFNNVTECPYFISVTLCDSFYLNDMRVDASLPTELAMINFQNSKNIAIENISLAGVNSTFASFKDSKIEAISGVQMTLLQQPLHFERSEVKLISDSNFTENSSNSSGGAIFILNSKIMIQNSTFSTNSAKKGGAITFECTSMAN